MLLSLNGLAATWWAWMWPMFWQATITIGLVAAIDRVIRRRVWPEVRYALWLLVLLKLVLPPTLTMPTSVTSGLHLLVRGSMEPVTSRETIRPGSTASPRPATARDLTDTSLWNGEAGEQPVVMPPLSAESAASVPVASQVRPSAAVTPTRQLSLEVYLMALWLLGMAVLAVRLAVYWRQLRRTHMAGMVSTELPTWLSESLAKNAEKLGLRRLPRIVLSPNISCPAVFGALRPVLLLPTLTVAGISRKDTQHILLHELAHIKRGDLWIHAAYTVLQITYWFNPLLWLTGQKLRHLRELCCDSTVAGILREKTAEYR